MATEKFILVSLEEEKAKGLANVISNDTSRKILAFLSEKDAAENDIARELNIPASTVHYNIQHLLKYGLIEVKDFYWSEKGNKVNVYTVAKKLIVIAPKSMKIKTKLKSILPAALLSLAASGMIYFYQNYFSKAASFAGREMLTVQKAADFAEAMPVRALAEAPRIAEAAPNYALWFLIGSFFAIATYIFITSVISKR
ncbi:MAG: helix-turn-helix domain-containing protein [Nanoarchaeota archaeon]|nr:helix-turn-helix domain-containing protein [Nanoarchaeota archaeon]